MQVAYVLQTDTRGHVYVCTTTLSSGYPLWDPGHQYQEPGSGTELGNIGPLQLFQYDWCQQVVTEMGTYIHGDWKV